MKSSVFLVTACALLTVGCEKKPAATSVEKEATTEAKAGTLTKFQKKLESCQPNSATMFLMPLTNGF